MYRKYVRKWWLLKRNRIIYPEIAVNSKFCLENGNFLWNCQQNQNFSNFLPWEIELFCEITWKKSKFFGNLPWKIDFFVKLPKKIEIFLENRIFLLNCLKNRNSWNRIFFKLPEKNRNFLWNCLKNQNSSEICLEKSTFFVKLPEKIEFFSPGSTTPPVFKPDWRRCCGVRMKQNSCFKFLPWPWVKPRTSQSNGHKCYH